MKENNGWVKLHRKIEDWCWFGDPNTFITFIHLLIMANIEDKSWRTIVIKRGSFVTSVSELAKRIGITVQQTRTALDKLISTREVTKSTTSTYTVISINNYEQYQKVTKSVTNEQQTDNKRVTTTKEYKNIRSKEDIYSKVISHYNESTKKNTKTIDERAVDFWLKEFSLEEIKQAISNLSLLEREEKDGGFWKGMTLVRFFRTRNANGKPDTIEQALNYQPKKQTLNMGGGMEL